MINMCEFKLPTGEQDFTKRYTPEATKAVIEREALDILYSLQITKRAMLSRHFWIRKTQLL